MVCVTVVSRASRCAACRYLCIVLLDLIVDEFMCGDPNAEAFLIAKSIVVAKIDLVFLCVFLIEATMRLTITLPSERRGMAFDFVVLLTGIGFDVALLRHQDEDGFMLVRLMRFARLARLARLIAVLHRFVARRTKSQGGASVLHRVVTPPRCTNWTTAWATNDSAEHAAEHGAKRKPQTIAECLSRASSEKRFMPEVMRERKASSGGDDAREEYRYAAFVSHKKADCAAEARYIHDQLELRLGNACQGSRTPPPGPLHSLSTLHAHARYNTCMPMCDDGSLLAAVPLCFFIV